MKSAVRTIALSSRLPKEVTVVISRRSVSITNITGVAYWITTKPTESTIQNLALEVWQFWLYRKIHGHTTGIKCGYILNQLLLTWLANIALSIPTLGELIVSGIFLHDPFQKDAETLFCYVIDLIRICSPL